jgi:SH3-like domain-containing protein
MVWLLFGSAALYVTGSTAISKKISFFSLLLFLLVTVSAGMLMIKNHIMTHVNQQAIIMSASVYVKSSPDENGNDLFILHEGTKADVMEEIGEWKKIKIANGSIGWIKESELEII